MKIKCNYCGTYFDDYQAQCPKCAAPSEGVVRTASKDPLTIEELKEWYKSKGLPPYEKTRFFIGEDYRQPRAFGIYKDPDTGIVVVYKNKDNGERAIRYQGTDEAYGVNEIFQRLKQEIIQQKNNNLKKNRSTTSQSAGSSSGSCLGSLMKIMLALAGIGAGMFAFIMILGTLVVLFTPKDGYYNYQNKYYYYDDKGYNDKYVFEYDDSKKEWEEPVSKKSDPGIFAKKRTCKKYFLSDKYDSSYGCSNISDSIIYQDYYASRDTEPGYYSTDNGYYYHYGYNYDSDWYYYDDDDWVPVENDCLPADLSHASSVNDFYYTPEWDETTQFSDFAQSDEYENNYSSDSSDSSWDNSDSDYSWDSSDSWDSGDTDFGSDW